MPTSGPDERGAGVGGGWTAICAEVDGWLRHMIEAPVAELSRAELIDEITALERLSNAAAARQARLAVAFDAAERQAQAVAGVPAQRRGQGVAAQIGLARRHSPVRAALFLSRAQTLCLDLPATMTAFVAGELSEYRAGLIATEVALLDPAGRAEVDRALCGSRAHTDALRDPLAAIQAGSAAANPLAGMSDRQVRAAAATAAYRVDPTTPLRRGRHAETERYVSLRPAPDTMTLSAYLPVRSGVACLASLRAAADTARACGDPRSQGQIMADTLIARLTGLERAADVPIELQLVLTDDALLADALSPHQPTHPITQDQPAGPHEPATAADVPGAAPPPSAQGPRVDSAEDDATPEVAGAERDDAAPIDATPEVAGAERDVTGYEPTGQAPHTLIRPVDPAQEPAYLSGYGPVSAATARAWLREGLDAGAKAWIRRLVTDPITGQVTALDTRSWLFPPALRRLILARDRYCRTPYCGAPIRHLDHAHPHAEGGATDATNGQGLCERCNHAKTAPGWTARRT